VWITSSLWSSTPLVAPASMRPINRKKAIAPARTWSDGRAGLMALPSRPDLRRCRSPGATYPGVQGHQFMYRWFGRSIFRPRDRHRYRRVGEAQRGPGSPW
jgi:hypothetical protein